MLAGNFERGKTSMKYAEGCGFMPGYSRLSGFCCCAELLESNHGGFILIRSDEGLIVTRTNEAHPTS